MVELGIKSEVNYEIAHNMSIRFRDQNWKIQIK